MNILKSKINFFEELNSLIASARNEISIFSPYIKTKALKTLLENSEKSLNITIITTWKPKDLAMGYSDLDLFPFCKDNNFPLLLNNNIHLKAIAIDNMTSIYIGSGNITHAGLGIGNKFNYELGVIHDDLLLDDKIYLDQIILESDPVDDEHYNKNKEDVKKLDKPKFDENFDIDTTKNKNFLLSSLPMSEDVTEFFNHYSRSNNDHTTEEEIRSAEHDRLLYKIPQGLNKSEFKKILKKNFLNHPFIIEYLSFIGDGKYFGETSAWLHKKVTTVPTPRRYNIKKTQNRINNFIRVLDDKYAEEIPGERSVRFFRKQR